MARHTSRMGLVTMITQSVRTAVRPGSAGIAERAGAVPRMLSAISRGEYRGTTFGHVAMLAAAVVYIVSPLDFMPEALFNVFGLTDDAIVVTWLVAALVNDTEAFLSWERGGGRAHGFAGAAAPDGRSAGPQDMPMDEWYHTVQSQVVR
ncbi:MAG: YkvA family protein [Lapillicoccus sp.]